MVCRALDGEILDVEFGSNSRPRRTVVELTIGLVATIAEARLSAEADDLFFPLFQLFRFPSFWTPLNPKPQPLPLTLNPKP